MDEKLFMIPTIDHLEVMQVPVGMTEVGILKRVFEKHVRRFPTDGSNPAFVRLSTKIDYLGALCLTMQQEDASLQESGKKMLEQCYNELLQQKLAAEAAREPSED